MSKNLPDAIDKAVDALEWSVKEIKRLRAALTVIADSTSVSADFARETLDFHKNKVKTN